MQLFEQFGAAFDHMIHGNCRWEPGLLKAELRDLQSDRHPHGEATQARLDSSAGELHDLALEYTWSEVAAATGSFAASCRLGQGASGTVFRGELSEGTGVAVKVIEGPVDGGFEEEVRLLSRCRHPNVVMLLGFSEEKPEDLRLSARKPPHAYGRGRRSLVYELLPGGDLHVRLRAQQHSVYPWHDRLRTAQEVARGLAHLHRHRPEIFHRDIKSQNILFGADGSAKIADFGLACMSNCRTARQFLTKNVAGTIGYADPLYARTGMVSEASEAYSFGMVLMELLTGFPPAVMNADGKSCAFLSDELRPWEDRAKHRVLQRLDPRARWPLVTAAGLSTLALLCIHDDMNRRPAFVEATTLLQELISTANAANVANVLDTTRVANDAAPKPVDACRGRWATWDEAVAHDGQVHIRVQAGVHASQAMPPAVLPQALGNSPQATISPQAGRVTVPAPMPWGHAPICSPQETPRMSARQIPMEVASPQCVDKAHAYHVQPFQGQDQGLLVPRSRSLPVLFNARVTAEPKHNPQQMCQHKR